MDYVFVEGLHVEGKHGHYDEEREQGNRFVVDCSVELDSQAAGMSDMLTDTVDYSRVVRIIEEIFAGSSVHLVETLCEAIAAAVLSEHARALSVTVRVTKLNPPGIGAVSGAGVEITRSRS